MRAWSLWSWLCVLSSAWIAGLLLFLVATRAYAGGGLTQNVPRPVLQFSDTTPVTATSPTPIPAATSSPLPIVASLLHDTYAMRVANTTAGFVGVYEGTALRYIIAPGVLDLEVGCHMNASSAVSLRNMANATLATGFLSVQFE